MTRDERNQLVRHFRAYSASFKGDRSEWADAWRRAMRCSIAAVDGVKAGKSYDEDAETWV